MTGYYFAGIMASIVTFFVSYFYVFLAHFLAFILQKLGIIKSEQSQIDGN